MRAMRVAGAMGLVIVLGGAALAFQLGGAVDDAPAADRTPIAGVETGLARIEVRAAEHTLDVVIGPLTLPAGEEGFLIPVQLVEVPIDAWLHGFAWRMEDARGARLPGDLLHHVNLIDPDRSELFGGTARRVIAVGRETSAFTMPRMLGYPLAAGTRLLIAAMFSNAADTVIENAVLRLSLPYTASPRRGPEPLAIFPFHMDVMGPLGTKSFPVPPGKTVRAWEGSPATDVRVLALGGHMHDRARVLLLVDVTTGRTLWRAEPEQTDGRVIGVPRASPWIRGGLRLHHDHVYRVTIEYDNPTDAATEHGGMGLVAGVVAATARWPGADRAHPAYVADLASLIAAPGLAGSGHGHGMHAAPAPEAVEEHVH
jgi:hypothetical protein